MTSPGIGASGIVGVALEQLAAPVTNAMSTAATGGTLADGTWKYVVTAINASGETNVSNEQTIVTAGGGLSTATITWATVTGATGYKVYRTAVNGATGTELLRTTLGVVLTFTDTGGAIAGALPSQNSANTSGTYKAPVKFIPILSENITYQQNTTWRRPMRGSAAVIGALAGDAHVEGDMQFEVTSDVLIYFLTAMRLTMAKTGTGPFTYTFTPSSAAISLNTLSITVVRNGIIFGYVGCVVSQITVEIQNEVLVATVSVVGVNEAVQGLPTATWPTLIPYDAGSYNLQIPTATTVFDADTYQFQLNGNASPEYRLSAVPTPQFISYAESEGTITLARDFLNRTEYDAFKALTAKSITMVITNGGTDNVTILTPVSIVDSFEVDLTGQGDLVRASITYQLAIDGTGKHYQITVVTPTESIF